ncbi:hypothetical protein [Paenibacillus amylolyticus]|uniref:hypothetical protein n=1 Tax=Paenibacillus amylolyticus TaxID=1451 RepID=UPI001F00D3D3|nr:hypothetical protein [Paenibacillus amylolyticus]
MTFNYEHVFQAYDRIKKHLKPTPLEESFYQGDLNRRYFFKLESFQRAKTFKIRGALNKMMTLSEEEKTKALPPFLQVTTVVL